MITMLLHKLPGLLIVCTCYVLSVCSVSAQTSNGDTTKELSNPAPEAVSPGGLSNTYSQPKEIEEYLNGISNPVFPRAVRKKWKEEALQLFAGKSVQVLDEKNGLGNRYTATALLDLLMDFPHQVKVREVVRNQQDKITELHLNMDRQTK